jgi:hypothetical protein
LLHLLSLNIAVLLINELVPYSVQRGRVTAIKHAACQRQRTKKADVPGHEARIGLIVHREVWLAEMI